MVIESIRAFIERHTQKNNTTEVWKRRLTSAERRTDSIELNEDARVREVEPALDTI
jgi:hypothetical protein